MLALSAAGALLPLDAQELSSVVSDRVGSAEGMVPTAVRNDERRSSLDLRAVISAAYNNNIFLSRLNPESDLVSRTAVSLAYRHGDLKNGDGGFIQVAYRPTGVIYVDHSHENRIDHQAAITAGWRGKASQITYTGAVQKLGDATADTGRPTDRLEFANELRAAWMPREKVTLELAVGNRQSNYSDPNLFDSRKTYGEVAMRYAYSPKTVVGIAYQAGRFEVDGADSQTTQQVTASIDWQPREKIHATLEAGAERRTTANGSRVNPVVAGRIDWTPRQGTSLYLTAYQREEASAFYAGQNYNVKGVTAGVAQRLGSDWTARLEAGRESATYRQVSGSGSGGRKDQTWFVRPALEYRLTDACDISLFYRISENTSSAADFGYNERIAGIELNYKF